MDDDGDAARVDALDQARGLGPRSAVEAGAEQGVDHDVRAREILASLPRRVRLRAGVARAMRPSPPFAPPPQTTAKRRASGKARSASRATAAAARSISSSAVSGKPGYRASAVRISSAA